MVKTRKLWLFASSCCGTRSWIHDQTYNIQVHSRTTFPTPTFLPRSSNTTGSDGLDPDTQYHSILLKTWCPDLLLNRSLSNGDFKTSLPWYIPDKTFLNWCRLYPISHIYDFCFYCRASLNHWATVKKLTIISEISLIKINLIVIKAAKRVFKIIVVNKIIVYHFLSLMYSVTPNKFSFPSNFLHFVIFPCFIHSSIIGVYMQLLLNIVFIYKHNYF